MTIQMLCLLLIIGGMIALFLSEKLPLEVTAACGLLFLVEAGFLSPEDAFRGFSSPVVITLMSSFCLAAALAATGITDRLAAVICRFAGGHEWRAVVFLMLIAAGFSAFMNNVAAAVLLLPTVAVISEHTRIAPSRLLIPLSIAVMLGGTLTLIGTTPNLLAAQLLTNRGFTSFEFTDFTPFGIIWVISGIGFVAWIGRRLLPQNARETTLLREQDLPRLYHLEERLFTARIPTSSSLSGITLQNSGIGRFLGLAVVSIDRSSGKILAPGSHEVLRSNDLLTLRGRTTSLEDLRRFAGIEVFPLRGSPGDLKLSGAWISVDVESSSTSLRALDLRTKTGASAVGLQRNGVLSLAHISSEILHPEDRLFVTVPPDGADRLEQLEGVTIHERNVPLCSVLGSHVFEIRLSPQATLGGLTIGESKIAERLGAVVLGRLRDGDFVPFYQSSELIEPGDTLVVSGIAEQVILLEHLGELQIEAEARNGVLASDQVGMTEVVLSPRSQLLGKSVSQVQFRQRYECQVLAILREGKPMRSHLAEIKLKFGDALLLQGPREKIKLLASDQDFVLFSGLQTGVKRSDRSPFVFLALGLMFFLMIFNFQPPQFATFLAAIVVVLSGALTIHEAYRAIEWRIVFFVAAILPLGMAVENVGLSQWLGDQFVAGFGGESPMLLLGIGIVLASMVSQLLETSLAVVLVGPIVIQTAQAMGLNPQPFIMGVALGASIAFLSPYSHRAHLLVMAPGGYSARDYTKVGLPLSIMLFIVCMVMIPLLFSFR